MGKVGHPLPETIVTVSVQNTHNFHQSDCLRQTTTDPQHTRGSRMIRSLNAHGIARRSVKTFVTPVVPGLKGCLPDP